MAQDGLSFDAAEAEPRDLHGDLRRIEPCRTRITCVFRAKRPEAVDRVDGTAQPAREAHGPADRLAAILRHLQPRDVERRQQELVRTRRLQQARGLAHALAVHARPVDEQHRSLRHRAEYLVGALRRHVGAAVDGLRRQGLREAQVRAVRLVDEQQHIVRMDERCDARKVKGHAVVRRVDAGQCLGLRMRCNGPGHCLLRQAHRDAEALVDLRLQKDGVRAREDDAADHRAVRIARHEHRIARAQRAHEHRVDSPRRAVDHEVRLIGAVERGRHFLRLLDTHRRLVQVVELLHQRDFLAKAFFRHERLQERMRAESLLVARRVISTRAVRRIGTHGLGNRCPQDVIPVLLHVILSPFDHLSTVPVKNVHKNVDNYAKKRQVIHRLHPYRYRFFCRRANRMARKMTTAPMTIAMSFLPKRASEPLSSTFAQSASPTSTTTRRFDTFLSVERFISCPCAPWHAPSQPSPSP